MTSSRNLLGHRLVLRAAAASLLALGASQAMAVNVTLCAKPYVKTLPGAGGTAVPMWGYRRVGNAANCGNTFGENSYSPDITVPAGDTELNVILVNGLTVPTSIVLAGQLLPTVDGAISAPVMAEDLVGGPCTLTGANQQTCRVRSFTGETDPGATRTYTFSNLKPGSYLYQSGTHPQVQIQMGLFGMVMHDAGVAGQLFARPDGAYDVSVPVVLSEIDLDQHAQIAATLGSSTLGDQQRWQADKHSTLKYAPTAYLINGRVFNGVNNAGNATTDLAVGAPPGARVVLRLANAGLMSRSLVLNSGTWKLLTEDGNPYPAPIEQASALLPAGKTRDARLISTAATDGSANSRVAIFDRRGGTEHNLADREGGQIARLVQTAGTAPFISAIPPVVGNEASSFSLALQGFNISSYALSTTAPGMTIDAGTGVISWAVPAGTIAPNVYAATVTGTATDGSTASRSFDARINHRPLMASSIQSVAHGSVTVAAPGLVASASDPDGDAPLTVVQTSAPASGTLALNADGSYTWTGPQPATGTTAVAFNVASRDPYGLQSAAATVTLNVAANAPPTGGTLGAFNNPGHALTLKPNAGLNLEISVPYQLTDPSALVIPFASLVNAVDPDGNIDPTSFLATSITKVNPANGAALARSGLLALGGAEATAVASGGNITFTPRRTALNTLLFSGNIDTGTANSAGTYRITYTVRDDQGALSTPGTIFIRVNRP